MSLAAVLKLHKPISWFPLISTLACRVILSAAPIVANRASLLGVKTAERFVEGLPGPRSPSDRVLRPSEERRIVAARKRRFRFGQVSPYLDQTGGQTIRDGARRPARVFWRLELRR